MKPIIFSLFHEALANSVAKRLGLELGQFEFKQFPDDESYLKIETSVKGRKVIVIDSLDRPNTKILPLLILSKTLKDLKADCIGLCAPYLPYLRQDKRFNPGEAITAKYFADLISHYFHRVLTVDPHLHRYKNLGEIYSIPSSVVHCATLIADWISEHVTRPVVIGPDQESEQWVASVANEINAPFVVLAKNRLGDKEVKILPPDFSRFYDFTPVIIDDIISSAATMIETVKLIKFARPVCITVHAIFAQNSYQELLKLPIDRVISCNTIPHLSNCIDLSELIAKHLQFFK